MKRTTKIISIAMAIFVFSSVFMAYGALALSSTQIYYPIDMSEEVLASRTQQQVSGDCAVVSMVTIESYLYGATTSDEKTSVYNALVSKNKDDNYANWGNCGYITASINWTDVYNQLAKGYPVIVHRPATSSKSQHWAVVAGYNGSQTTLEKDRFIIVDVYHGSGGKDIYTSAAWRGSVTIDRMTYRKNGISITSLEGIRFAIDHPVLVHQYGKGHGVYGYITSNTNLVSIQFLVTRTDTGKAVYNKTVTPNSKSYLIYNLDSEFTFAKWDKGEYYFAVIAKTASEEKKYNKYFQIASGWPETAPQGPSLDNESPDDSIVEMSETQIYYPIDMSKEVLASRTQQQVSGDCAVVSMVTIESYLYGAMTSDEKTSVYNALVSKNKDDNYANWGNCGYLTASIDWVVVYNQLAKGYPVIVHRPATSEKSEHWAVVAGYNGSHTTLDKEKFIIVDVYHGSGAMDIYASAEWRGSVTIDRMAYRKNGIEVTSLEGIRFAIDHPVLVHQYGKGHGVYGYITSNTNLASIQFLVTRTDTGKAVYNKTVTPNSKSYLIYNLDSEFTFAKWDKGEYYFTVIAKTASEEKKYNKYFQIASGWPVVAPEHSEDSSEQLPNEDEISKEENSDNTEPDPSESVSSGTSLNLKTESEYILTENALENVKERTTVAEIKSNFENQNLIIRDSEGNELSEYDICGTGCIVVLCGESDVIDEIYIVVKGDVDGDGEINSTDYLRIKGKFLGTYELSGVFFSSADIDSDDSITTTDYLKIKSYFLNVSEL